MCAGVGAYLCSALTPLSSSSGHTSDAHTRTHIVPLVITTRMERDRRRETSKIKQNNAHSHRHTFISKKGGTEGGKQLIQLYIPPCSSSPTLIALLPQTGSDRKRANVHDWNGGQLSFPPSLTAQSAFLSRPDARPCIDYGWGQNGTKKKEEKKRNVRRPADAHNTNTKKRALRTPPPLFWLLCAPRLLRS